MSILLFHLFHSLVHLTIFFSSTAPPVIKMTKMMQHLMSLCPGKFILRCQEMAMFKLILAVAGEAHSLEKLVGRS